MAQHVVVAVVVLVALLYVIWYNLPKAFRQRLGLAHPATKADRACGSCSSCTGCSATPKVGGGTPRAAGPQVIRVYPVE